MRFARRMKRRSSNVTQELSVRLWTFLDWNLRPHQSEVT